MPTSELFGQRQQQMRRGYGMVWYIYRARVLVACLESRVASSCWRYIKELLLTAPSSGVEDKCVDGDVDDVTNC